MKMEKEIEPHFSWLKYHFDIRLQKLSYQGHSVITYTPFPRTKTKDLFINLRFNCFKVFTVRVESLLSPCLDTTDLLSLLFYQFTLLSSLCYEWNFLFRPVSLGLLWAWSLVFFVIKVQRKVVIDPWDIIEGFRNPPGVNAPPPIPWSYFSAVRVDRKLLTAESNASQAAWHSHTLIKPAEYFLEAPPLPAEEDLPVARTPGGGMLMDEPATSETASVDTASPRSPRSARAPKPKKAAAGQGRFRFQFWIGKKSLSFIWLHLTLAVRWNSFSFSTTVSILFCNEHDLSKNHVKKEWRTQLDENPTQWLQLGQQISPFGRGKLCSKCNLHDGVS